MFVQIHVKKFWSLKILGSNLTMSILYLKCPLILPALLSQWTAFYHPCCCCYPKQSCCTAQRLDAAGPVLAAANTPQCNSKGWGSNNQCWIHPVAAIHLFRDSLKKECLVITCWNDIVCQGSIENSKNQSTTLLQAWGLMSEQEFSLQLTFLHSIHS